MVEALGKDPTLTGRTEIWNLLLGLRTNPWVGTGFESFWLGPRVRALWDALDGFPVNEAHNAYIEVYLNLGWVGICFIGLLLVTGYKRVTSAIRRDSSKASLFLGFLLCTIFYSFTEAAFRLMSPALIFLYLVIVAGSHRVLFRSRTTETVDTGEIAADEKLAYAPQLV